MDSQNNQPAQPSQEELLAIWQEKWKEEEAKLDFPFTKKEFTFTRHEVKQLLQQGTIQALSQQAFQIAESATNDIVNLVVLPRVSILPNAQTRVLYDLNSGHFMVWSPKEDKKDVKTPKLEEVPTSEPSEPEQ